MQAFQDIFISYGRKDSLEFASRLNRRLVDRGFTVWFDYDDIPLGVDYQKQIDDGIERADNFLFIISPHSINSTYCGLELALALKYQKRIIPILYVEKIRYETWQQRNPDSTEEDWANYQIRGEHDHFQNMHPVLRKINWVYMREGRDDFEAEFARLLEIFDRHKTYVHQHTLFLVKALEWERHQKRSRYLLIGEERLQAEEWLKIRFTESQPPCILTDLHCEFIAESHKNANNLMTEVFLAYAEEDRAIAEQIRKCLWREGFTVWMNTTDIRAGAEFQKAINQGIEEADNLVFLLSAAAVRSPYCQQELEYALSLNKRIIPVLVEAMPPEQLPPKLRDLHYIDLPDKGDKAGCYRLDEGRLLQVLRQDATYHGNHKLFLTKALKWKRQQCNPTLLLRGYNLRQGEAWLKVALKNLAYPPLALQDMFIGESRRQPPGISLDVFISYSRADSGFARKLNDQLQIHGKRTWFDQESIAAGTADFQKEIHSGIESSDIFLFILSPRSVKSPYCADEVEYAARLNKRIVTILHRPVETSTLHPELAKVQWLDFNQHDRDFSANFTELLRILDTDTEHLHSHTRLLLRAIEWEEKGRKESLLLRDDELENAEQWLSQCISKEPKPTDLQRSYLKNSRSLEDARQQAHQILTEAAAKGRRLVRFGAIASAVGLLIAGSAIGYADRRINAITLESKIETAQEQLAPDSPLKALLDALRAGQTLTNLNGNTDQRSKLMGILQESVQTVRERNSLEKHKETITSIRFSPDGKTLASGSFDGTIILWNVETGENLYTLEGHEGEVWNVSFSPDGKTVASASADATVKLWDVETGQELRTLKGLGGGMWGVSFSPDGKTVAASSADKTVRLWDVKTGQKLHTLIGHEDRVFEVIFSPDGQAIASASHDDTIRLWNTETGELLHELKGHQDNVESIDFSPDGKTIASASVDKTIKLWDVETGQELETFEGHQDIVQSVRFSPDGKAIASGSWDKTIKLWNVETGEELHTLIGHQDTVWSVRFSPDNKMIASGSDDHTVKLWNVETGEIVDTLNGHQDEVWSISFSPNSPLIASGSADKTIKLWAISDRELNSLNGNALNGHQDIIWSTRFSTDGNTIASGSFDTTIKLWDVENRNELKTLTGHQDIVFGISFSPDSTTIASGSADNTIKLWNVQTGNVIKTLSGHEDDVLSISFSPDGKTIASGSADKTIKLWDVATGTVVKTLEGHEDAVPSISFSPDGTTIASGSMDATVKLRDVATGQALKSLSGYQNAVLSVRFSPDGQTLASGSADRTINLWQVTSGKLLQTLKGHDDAVFSIDFSPDGQTLASSSVDRTLKTWDLKSGQEIYTLRGHEDTVSSISFSPDGKTIVSGSFDTTIRFWVWDFGRLMNTGCNLIQPYLITQLNEPGLCKGYLPDEPSPSERNSLPRQGRFGHRIRSATE